ncbi:MAG: glutamine-hydrolyzing carbamoyl-phosphate synthase small subunit [Andreesenia angusta]|nr:glutamine-hydrolyzing carbamoyl-phosphate synthase small subunit [Andreesenia angusta]
MSGIIYLEDGTIYKGEGFGAKGTIVGELDFNTSMIGYQEVLEDSSNAGLILNMTYPWIGNYGVKDSGKKAYAKGIIVKAVTEEPSNYECNKTLIEYMKERGIVGIKDVDTRAITRKIRRDNVMKCVITNEDLSEEELKERIKEDIEYNLIEECSIKEIEKIEGNDLNIGILDLGQKDRVLEVLEGKNLGFTLFPYNTTKKEIDKEKVDAIIVTNGPGLASEMVDTIETVKELAKDYAIFGISLGHQIISIALGAKVRKMTYGHRGSNHGVYDYNKNRAFIVPQNHGYVIDENSLAGLDLKVSHINLNDSTIEGIEHNSLNIQSIQFELEKESDLANTSYILNSFIDSIREGK